jgi:hypothetical protein
VQDDEEVVVVLVDLRALVAREDVLVVEGMELEVLLQPRAVGLARALDVDPAQPARDPAGGLDDLDVRALRLAGACGDGAARAARPAEPRLGQARHGDLAVRRSRARSA